MADPYENVTPGARRAERDRQRRIILSLPRTTDVQRFLADLATLLLDGRDRTQDALLALVDTEDVAPVANDQGAAILRLALVDLTDLFGRIVMATRFGVSIVTEAMAMEEIIPGVSANVMRAVRTAHTARQEADRRTREAAAAAAAARNAAQPRRSAYYQPQQQASASQPAAANQPPSQQAAAQPAARQDPRQVFPCHTCNKRGHWKGEGLCLPADITANLARLSALVNPGQLALPAPAEQGMSNHVCSSYHLFSPLFLCACPIISYLSVITKNRQ
jgi:hypothetical protein